MRGHRCPSMVFLLLRSAPIPFLSLQTPLMPDADDQDGRSCLFSSSPTTTRSPPSLRRDAVIGDHLSSSPTTTRSPPSLPRDAPLEIFAQPRSTASESRPPPPPTLELHHRSTSTTAPRSHPHRYRSRYR
jgi:hypothetical protein